jgi:hypothetical protein
MLFASGLGLIGAFKRPGADLFIDVALAAGSGLVYWLCQRGRRSVRFLRSIEACGLFLFFSGASLLGRYVLIGFLQERALVTREGVLMADTYLSVMGTYFPVQPSHRLTDGAFAHGPDSERA